ncbi:hypothetical protein DFJ77DRAFT_542990 [Powellomyces hirtus]|nr:hypothetical protein DFJ77DRAFT_542990 [Powellomyces hirtus]
MCKKAPKTHAHSQNPYIIYIYHLHPIIFLFAFFSSLTLVVSPRRIPPASAIHEHARSNHSEPAAQAAEKEREQERQPPVGPECEDAYDLANAKKGGRIISKLTELEKERFRGGCEPGLV